MNSKKAITAAAAVVAVAACLLIAYNRWWSPAARARAAVEGAAESVAEKDAAGVLEAVSPDFEQGGMDRDRVGTALGMLFSEFDKFKVNVGGHTVRVSGDEAVDSINVVVVVSKGGQQGYLLGQFGNPARLGVRLRRRGRWLITGVDGLPGY